MNSAASLRFRQEGSDPIGIHFSGSRRPAFRETACALLEGSRLSSASYACRFQPETSVAEPLCTNLFRMIDLQKSIKTNNFNPLQNLYLQKIWGEGVLWLTRFLPQINRRERVSRVPLSAFCFLLSAFRFLHSAFYLLLPPSPLATISPCPLPIP